MLRKTILVRALSLAFSTAALTAAVVPTAMAQSNTTGNIVGTVASPAGSTVSLHNLDTGLKRTVTPEANGRYLVTALPVGHYKVELIRDSKVVDSTEVDVIIGQGVDASFASAIQAVQVTGRRSRIDVTNTNNGATFSAKELAKLPIARNVEAIIQLAPNTTRADERFAGGASFGGGAASENSYYINGFPVVNPLTGLGASQLPFGAIAQAEVLTGGFGAEFGRSIGGVVNITTKSGTNNWEAGGQVSYQPKSLRSDPHDLNYAKTGAPENAATDGTLRRRRTDTEREEKVYSAYVGGPIIKDKLFMFLAAEQTDRDVSGVTPLAQGERLSTSLGRNGWRQTDTQIQRYMAKVDWYITDNHRLEFTSLGDTPEVTDHDSGYDYSKPGSGNGVITSNVKKTNVDNNGGKTNMLKYTGSLTDDLTLTALGGRTKSVHKYEPEGYDPTQVLYSVVAPSNARAPGVSYPDVQPIAGNILADGSQDIVKSYRLDLEYKLGKHTIRGGIDKNKVESLNAGEYKAGGGTWTYAKTDKPNEAQQGTGGPIPAPASGGGLGLQGYYVSKGLFSDVTSSYGEQTAQYVEDKYQVTKDILVTGGIRRESFKNQNGDKQTFLEMKNQYNPRLAASWDVHGDSSLKVFGTAGRYSVPIPTHITVRGAGRSTFTDQYFTYTGVDANGAPLGLVKLTEPQSGNNEFGQEKDLKTLAALDMKPAYQDELTLGFEKAFSPSLNFGAKVTYRKLKSTIDDFCDVRPFEAFAARNKIAITNPLWGNTCQTFNPGEDNDFYVDFVGGGKNDTLVHLTAAEQGFDKPKRTYAALDVFAEHPLRNGWYGKVNYTLSRNAGNTEGQVRSDNGQADVAVSSTWDYPELMIGADGRLPNDRKHQIKAFGFYEITQEWGVGANLLLASGRPRSCIGTEPNPAATGSPGYTNQTFYCGGATRSQNVIIPRGTIGDLPWDKRLDMNIEYKPNLVKGLSLKMDVFNVTNTQVVSSVSEARNVRGNTRIASTYESPLSYTQPREVKFTAAYDHKF
jgi:hypothetical protein